MPVMTRKRRTQNQEIAARALSPEELRLADLELTHVRHGMLRPDCLVLAGFESLGNREGDGLKAGRILKRQKVVRYMDCMKRESIKRADLSLEYIDRELGKMIYGHDIANIINANGTLRVASLDELSRAERSLITGIKGTRYGLEISIVTRVDLMKLAYQRFGALSEKHILVGDAAAPVALRAMDREEYREARTAMLELDDV